MTKAQHATKAVLALMDTTLANYEVPTKGVLCVEYVGNGKWKVS